MDQNGLHVVLGAAGGPGSALVEELAARGRRVRGVYRREPPQRPGVETALADALDRDSLSAACRGAAVVYNCLNIPYTGWKRTWPTLMNNTIEVAAHERAALIFVDNLYAYGKAEMPLTEETPYRPIGQKGRLRVQLANSLLDAHRRGAVRGLIARGSDFLGPRANSLGGNLVMPSLIAGKRAMWIGSLDQPHTLSFLPDLARALITLAEHEEAFGQVWHAPADSPLTGRQYLTTASELAGVKPNFGVYSAALMRLVGLFVPIVREAVEELYQFQAPFVMDSAKFVRAFGANVTPNREAIRQTVEWYKTKRA